MYTKRFTQLNSCRRACNNILVVGESEVPALTNNLVGFCSYGHTNIIPAESAIAGYIVSEVILTALKSILKKMTVNYSN
jgi:hypothetical protein